MLNITKDLIVITLAYHAFGTIFDNSYFSFLHNDATESAWTRTEPNKHKETHSGWKMF